MRWTRKIKICATPRRNFRRNSRYKCKRFSKKRGKLVGKTKKMQRVVGNKTRKLGRGFGDYFRNRFSKQDAVSRRDNKLPTLKDRVKEENRKVHNLKLMLNTKNDLLRDGHVIRDANLRNVTESGVEVAKVILRIWEAAEKHEDATTDERENAMNKIIDELYKDFEKKYRRAKHQFDMGFIDQDGIEAMEEIKVSRLKLKAAQEARNDMLKGKWAEVEEADMMAAMEEEEKEEDDRWAAVDAVVYGREEEEERQRKEEEQRKEERRRKKEPKIERFPSAPATKAEKKTVEKWRRELEDMRVWEHQARVAEMKRRGDAPKLRRLDASNVISAKPLTLKEWAVAVGNNVARKALLGDN